MKNKKMKRLFVFVPAILMGLFLLNSFVLKGNEAKKKLIKEGKSFFGVKLAGKRATDPFAQDSIFNPNSNKSALVKTILKSTDGGQTWRDISKTPPEIELPASQSNIVKAEGVQIATGQKGIKRSTDNGKHWEWVIAEGGVGITVERINGGFAAISYNTATRSRRIRISLDKGKTWQAIDEGLRPSSFISSIKQIGQYLICGHPDGIFRSSDMGKTWKRVLCGVNNNDNNKEFKFSQTWNSPPSEPKKVFRLYVSDNVLYAVVVPAGC